MNLDGYVGKSTGAVTTHVERGSVSRFAHAVTDDNPVYKDLGAAREAGFDAPPAPPTWTFAAAYLGAYPEEQPEGDQSSPLMSIMGALMKTGGMILHGEQEFRYHQPVQCGDVLHSEGKITDIYAKESKGRTMTFIVMETVYKNAAGEPVVTEVFNLIHRGE